MAFEQQPWFTAAESSEAGDTQGAFVGGAPRWDGTAAGGPTSYYGGGGLVSSSSSSSSYASGPDFSQQEPPLLEELGISFADIWSKTKIVLKPTTAEIDEQLVAEPDLAGPIVFAFCLGGTLLLHGKVHFGYIYGFGACSCAAMYLLLNLMAARPASIDFAFVASFLGYCLLPVIALAATALVVRLTGTLGTTLAAVCVLLCTCTATRLFEAKLHMRHQRYLIAYPLALVYSVFVLITIF